MISVSDQTRKTRNISQKIGINFKTSWLSVRTDLKTESLQKSWFKADKRIWPIIFTVIWNFGFLLLSLFITLLGWHHGLCPLKSDGKVIVLVTLIPHSLNYWTVLTFKIILRDFFPPMDFLQILQWQ